MTIVSEGEYIAEMFFLRSYTEALTCTCLDTIQSSSGQNIMLHSFAGNFSAVEQYVFTSLLAFLKEKFLVLYDFLVTFSV